MATPILIVCPECGKQVKAPEKVLGKKVRCKYCRATFVASASGGKTPPAKSAKPPAGKGVKSPADKKATKPAKLSLDDEEDEDPNPYALQDVSLAPRCPDCANEIEEGQVICLHCGYNMRTRQKAKTRKVYDQTFKDYFFWLLPGIACALAVFGLIGFNAWYLTKFNDLVDDNSSFFLWIWSVSGIKLWVVIMSIGLIWLAGKFAVKRLIFHHRPPEVEKLK
jgi:DNA-directed RNA polymerase subunit M/transcription elongation factor TFIIS